MILFCQHNGAEKLKESRAPTPATEDECREYKFGKQTLEVFSFCIMFFVFFLMSLGPWVGSRGPVELLAHEEGSRARWS